MIIVAAVVGGPAIAGDEQAGRLDLASRVPYILCPPEQTG
jgi:hypothetical protein